MNFSSNKNSFTLKVHKLSRKFDNKVVFNNISFEVSSGQKLAITGRNGSGKSTLLKLICGVLSPTYGGISFALGNNPVSKDKFPLFIGFAAPYLNFYDEMTAEENLKTVCRLKGIDDSKAESILSETELYERKNDPVGIFSSGMKQRLRLAFAVMHSPVLLLLDEPMVNLDSSGIALAEKIITNHNGILIIATNDEREKRFCESEISLDREC